MTMRIRTQHKVREPLRDRLRMNVDDNLTQQTHILGRKQHGRNRPIICKVHSDKKKEIILKTVKKTKGF